MPLSDLYSCRTPVLRRTDRQASTSDADSKSKSDIRARQLSQCAHKRAAGHARGQAGRRDQLEGEEG